MSLLLIQHRDLLERLRKKTGATIAVFQSAVDEAEHLYQAELDVALKRSIRLGRSAWARGEHGNPPLPQETQDALETMNSTQRKLVSAVLEIIRSSPSTRAW